MLINSHIKECIKSHILNHHPWVGDSSCGKRGKPSLSWRLTVGKGATTALTSSCWKGASLGKAVRSPLMGWSSGLWYIALGTPSINILRLMAFNQDVMKQEIQLIIQGLNKKIWWRNIFTRRRRSSGSIGQLQKLELDRTAHESTVEDLAGNETYSVKNQEYSI